MAKLTLDDTASGYNASAKINANNDLIEAALENTLSRDGTSPNTMSADLDMNTRRVTNLTDPSNAQDAATKAYADALLSGTTDSGAAQLRADLLDSGGSIAVDSNIVTYTQDDTGAAARSADTKLQEYVSITDFGAVGDGSTDNTAAINLALGTGKSVYVPYSASGFKFTGKLNMTTKGQTLFGDGYSSYLNPVNTGGNTLEIQADDVTVRGIRFEGSTPGVVRLGKTSRIYNPTIDSCYFSGVGQCIWVHSCDSLKVTNNHFTLCGYQIIQQVGYSSNDCLVANNTAIDNSSDFVELNCEASNPSTNWTIVSNSVKSVGMRGAPNATGAVRTESRFVGVTLVDGVIIANNIVDGVAGDSAIHLEKPGRTIITGNVLRNCNGPSGAARFVYILTQAVTGWDTRQEVVISDNVFMTSETALTNCVSTWIGTGSVSDSDYIKLENNMFLNFGASYPGDLPTPEGDVVNFSSSAYLSVKGNIFRNFATGVRVSNASINPSIIDENIFIKCTVPINITATGACKSYSGNTFESCGVPTLDTKPDKMGENTYVNMTVGEFKTQVLTEQDGRNKYTGTTTHDDFREGVTVTHSVATNMFKVIARNCYILSVVAQRDGSSTNNKREIFFISNRSGDFQVTSLGSHTEGTAPTITITATGTAEDQLVVTITGGTAANHVVTANISGVAS